MKRVPAPSRAGAARAPRTKRILETQSEEEDDDFDADMPALVDVSDSEASDDEESEWEAIDNEEVRLCANFSFL